MSHAATRIRFAIPLKLALLSIVGLAVASASWAQSALTCSGPIPKDHPYGSFNFQTNSRVEDKQFKQFKQAIVSCVSNDDTVHPLYVKWLIPGPDGWIPAKRKLDSVPRLIRDDQVFPLKGCFLYGNRGDATHSQFLGTASDQSAVDDETARGCRLAAAGPKDGRAVSLEDIILFFRNFFPSDAKNPQSTMLQVEGEIGIRTLGPSRYTSYLNYRVNRYHESPNGVIANTSLRPRFRGPTEALLPFFHRSNSSIVKITEKGHISFEVADVRDPTLFYASYEIRDQNEEVVGAIDFPVFVFSRK